MIQFPAFLFSAKKQRKYFVITKKNCSFASLLRKQVSKRRDGRVVDRGGLENR